MTNTMTELGMNDQERLAVLEGAAMLLVDAISEAGPEIRKLATTHLLRAGHELAGEESKRPIYWDLARLIRRTA